MAVKEVGVSDAEIAAAHQAANVALDKFDQTRLAEKMYSAAEDADHPYHLLATTLLRAFEQAAAGKGKERHAHDGSRRQTFKQE